MKQKELYNICHDEAVAYANSEQWSKRTGEEKSFLIQGYLDAMMEMRKSEITEMKKEYPKTYEECLPVLEIYNRFPDVEVYNAKPSECKLFESLIRLKRCRDAYWKIAGEEMGLGKPWEPDYTEKTVKYCLRTNYGRIVQTRTSHDNHPFSFPTEEMRDAFYENFDKDLELCKELL